MTWTGSGSASDGIVVGRAGITINLNGHTLTGPGSSICCYFGIDDTDGYDKVTVENGTVSNYFDYVQFGSTTGHGSSTSRRWVTTRGLASAPRSGGVIDHSTVSHNNTGMNLVLNTNLKVTSSRAAHNGLDGIEESQSLDTLNQVTANANGGSGVSIDQPARVGSNYDTIENSTANHNFQSGFLIQRNSPTYLYQAIVLDNTASDNGQYGFYADLRTKGKGNHASGNGTANCWHVPCS